MGRAPDPPPSHLSGREAPVLAQLSEEVRVGLRDRLRRAPRPGTPRSGGAAELDHLATWAAERRGVEGFVEPETSTTSTTLVLVAHDGEWTRRRVSSPKDAFGFGSKAGIPVYDVAAVGYPKRMREWTAQRRAAGELGPPRS